MLQPPPLPPTIGQQQYSNLLPPLTAQPTLTQPTTPAPAKRPHTQMSNSGFTDNDSVISLLHNQINMKDYQIQEMNAQIQRKDIQIQQKDEQINNLQRLLNNALSGTTNHRRSPSSHPKTPTTLKPSTSSNGPFTYARAAATKTESTANYIVITNIAEDVTSSDGKALSEKEVAEELLQRIQLPNVEVQSAVRMGVKKDGSKRPIKAKLASNEQRQFVLKNAPAAIKNDDVLKQNKVFVNKLVPKEAYPVQKELSQKRNILQKLEPAGSLIRFFIKNNQLYRVDKSTPNIDPELVDCIENNKAATFYGLNNPFRAQHHQQPGQSITTNDASMDSTTTIFQ